MAKPSAVAPLFKALGEYKSILISIGCFTALINLLMLVPSIYMLQVYDRVLSSQNETTLVMLTLMVVGFFAFIGTLEVIRSFIVIRIGSQLERRFNLRVYKAAFERNLQRGQGHAGQSLGDLTHIRQFITGPALFAFFDAPWFPIYLFVIFLFNVWLGVLATAGAVLLIGLACLNEYLTKKPLGEASGFSQQSTQLATSHLHNAETIQAMGMLGALRKRWFAVHSQFLGLQNTASDTGSVITSLSKSLRLCLQSLVLGLGALLVIRGDMTAGMMIAGSILMGRVLSPIDQLIAVWKQWSSAKLAYQRLDELLREFPPEVEQMKLPAPKGQISLEQVSAGPPGRRMTTLHQVSFNSAPAKCWACSAPRVPANPPWPACWWVYGQPWPVPCGWMAPTFIAGTATTWARISVTCLRTLSCSAAASPTTSRVFARPTPSLSSRRHNKPACMN